MSIRTRGKASARLLGTVILLLAGCRSAQQPEPVKEDTSPDMIEIADETQRVAEAALGKQAEVLAYGDLARNQWEQLLVVNRFVGAPHSSTGPDNPAAIFITRAAILEKSNGKWAEILRCDEHLKNPNGYLGGSPTARITGWRLEFNTETKQGLEIKFTPADDGAGKEGASMGVPANQTIVVRWNTRAKRYQSLDPSHQGYLSEAPTLETPYSILR